jgi:hypothetical protein
MSSVRERREHRVYETLLKTIPNFEERLMNSSEEEIAMIADLASLDQLIFPGYTDHLLSCKRGHRAPDRMIPRVSRAS